MPKPLDLAGQRFGRLHVVSRAGSNRHQKVTWTCQCDCGRSTVVSAPNLVRGYTQSCGCIKREALAERNRAGRLPGSLLLNGHPLSATYYGMIGRCEQPSHRSYAAYGGRGIAVCDRWRSSFDAFLADMGPKPTPQHTLDRIDNDGPYSPENCRWATRREQSMNRLRPRGDGHHWTKLTDDGVRQIRKLHRESNVTQKELARRFGVSPSHVSKVVAGHSRQDV